MGEGDLPFFHPLIIGQDGGAAADRQRRTACEGGDDLDVLPPERAQPDSQGFHGRLLGGKASGKGRRRVRPPVGVGPLVIGEQARREGGTASQHGAKTANVDRVDSEADQR